MQNAPLVAVTTIAVHAVALFGPGLAVAAVAGLRGWVLLASGPLVTFGLIGVTGPLLSVIGIPWSALTFAVCAVLAVTVAAVLRVAAARSGRRAAGSTGGTWLREEHLVVAAAVALAGAVGCIALVRGSRYLTGVHQIWDAHFHANAVRFIAESGDAAPTALGAINVPAWEDFFYPNAHHALGAVVWEVSGASVPVVLNAASAHAVGLFALSLVALVRVCGGRPAIAGAAALLACACTAFPYDVLTWGPLLPYVIGVALVPALMAVLVASLDGRPGASPLLGIAAVGLLALHPGAAFAAGVLGLVLVAARWGAARRVPPGELARLAVAGTVAGVLGMAQVRGAIGTTGVLDIDWPAQFRPSDAVGQLLTLGHARAFPQWWLVLSAAIGLGALRLLTGLRWYVVGSAAFGGLFVLAASYEGPWVALLTRPWWNDEWRMVALFVPAVVLLGAAGAVGVADLAVDAVRRVRPLPAVGGRRAVAGATVAVLAVVALGSEGLYHRSNEERVAQGFTDGPTVSRADVEAFGVLASLVPDGARVMNDPQDGSPWMWALEGVRPVFGHALMPAEIFGIGADRERLLHGFSDIDTDGAVQGAARRLDVRYLYISRGFTAPDNARALGLQDVDRVRSLRTRFENADATVYEVCVVTGCAPDDPEVPGSLVRTVSTRAGR